MASWKEIQGKKLFWPIVALILLFLFNLFFTPHFFRVEIKDGHLYGNVIDILKNGAPIMMLAIGLTLVIATKGIDISVGSVVAISAGVVAMMIGGDLQGIPKYPIALAIGAAILVSVIAGLWNGMLVSRIGMQPIIATLILFVAGRGIAMVTTNAMVVWLYAKPFAFLGQGYLLGLPFSIFMVLLLLLFTAMATRRTSLGLFIEAVGINAKAAHFAGINAKNILLGVYAFSGFCAGVSGLVVCSTVMSADGNNAGLGYEMDAILAVVIGGTSMNGGKFYLVGSIIGALVVETLTTTIYAFGVPPEISKVVKALVVWAVSLLQSQKFRDMIAGAFGRKEVSA